MSSTDHLFALYTPTPRARELGHSVYESSRAGAKAVGYVLVGGLVLGALLGLLTGRSVVVMLVAGLAMGVVALPIALIPFMIMRAYVGVFETGRLVEGVVVEERGGGSVLRVAAGPGPDLVFVGNLRPGFGARLPFLVGGATSSRALCVVAPSDLRRCTLLTPAQLQQVAPPPAQG